MLVSQLKHDSVRSLNGYAVTSPAHPYQKRGLH